MARTSQRVEASVQSSSPQHGGHRFVGSFSRARFQGGWIVCEWDCVVLRARSFAEGCPDLITLITGIPSGTRSGLSIRAFGHLRANEAKRLGRPKFLHLQEKRLADPKDGRILYDSIWISTEPIPIKLTRSVRFSWDNCFYWRCVVHLFVN